MSEVEYRVKVTDLDKRICEVETDAMNSETYREYIRTTENEFGVEPSDIDNMTDKQLNEYLEFLDDLWGK